MRVNKVAVYSKEFVASKSWDNIRYDFVFVCEGEDIDKVLKEIEVDESAEVKIEVSEVWAPEELREMMEEAGYSLSLTQAAIARCNELN